MQFFDVKANKLYDFLSQMPLQNKKNQSRNTSNKFLRQYDSFYNFYLKGKQLTVAQIEKLFKSKPDDENLIIAKRKSEQKKVIDYQNLYDSHRDKIEEYSKETKQNDVKSIRQNAEFIFQKTIDGNFKFRAFQHYDSASEFTAERKEALLNQIFMKICNDPSQSIDVIDWSEKQQESRVLGESAKKNLQKIEEKAEQYDGSDEQNQVKSQKIQEKRFSSIKKERQNPQKSDRVNLQLHQLMYITEHWKQINTINKCLMKHSCDNPSYYEELKIQYDLAMKEQPDEHQGDLDQQI